MIFYENFNHKSELNSEIKKGKELTKEMIAQTSKHTAEKTLLLHTALVKSWPLFEMEVYDSDIYSRLISQKGNYSNKHENGKVNVH